jgi:hypothetical protein
VCPHINNPHEGARADTRHAPFVVWFGLSQTAQSHSRLRLAARLRPVLGRQPKIAETCVCESVCVRVCVCFCACVSSGRCGTVSAPPVPAPHSTPGHYATQETSLQEQPQRSPEAALNNSKQPARKFGLAAAKQPQKHTTSSPGHPEYTRYLERPCKKVPSRCQTITHAPRAARLAD